VIDEIGGDETGGTGDESALHGGTLSGERWEGDVETSVRSTGCRSGVPIWGALRRHSAALACERSDAGD
jgi:hypothetical protein